MKKLSIDLALFMMTFAADEDYYVECRAHETYLNKRTGELMMVSVDNNTVATLYGKVAAADIKKNLRKLRASPNNYLRIPSMSHGEYHDLLQEFLGTSWTSDTVAHNSASTVYYERRSIGYWLNHVHDDNAISRYREYKDAASQQHAEQFLRNNRIDFEWL